MDTKLIKTQVSLQTRRKKEETQKGEVLYSKLDQMYNNKEKWLPLLMNGEALCYFKPCEGNHESSWKNFEIGYCTVDDKHNMLDKLVIGTHSDHIWYEPHFGNNLTKKGFSMNMDCTLDGYIRIWSMDRSPIYWGSFEWTNSSAFIEFIENT